MVDPFGIIGLTGTAGQLVDLVKDLIERHDAYKNNKPLAEELLGAYTSLSEHVVSLQKDPNLNTIQEHHRQILQHEISSVSVFVTKTLSYLTKERENPKKMLHAFAKAKSDRDVLIDRKREAEEQREKIMLASIPLNVIGEVRNEAARGDVFRASSIAPQNPDSVYIDLCLPGGVEQPQSTCERQLKATVLKTDGSAQVGAFARGQGGVGKTCALRAIANDAEIKDHFRGGIYFMQLGKDANIAKLIQQLCRPVTATGGCDISDKMREKQNLDETLDLMLSWFGGHICLFIFDDVWARNGIDTNVLNQLSVLVGNSKDKDGRMSRILYSTRDGDLTMAGVGVDFNPRQKHGTEVQKMLLKASFTVEGDVNDANSKTAVHDVLDMCAGLPLALNVAGKNIRIRKGRNGGDFAGACNAYLHSVRDRGGVLAESPGDGYDFSLEATLRSSLVLLDSNLGASSVKRMSFKEMHRGLCVMKKQDKIPMVILCDLWDTQDEREAEKFADEMDRAGLVDRDDIDYAGVRVHDLTHDFAMREAGESCVSWYTKLLDIYGGVREGGLVEAACRGTVTGGNSARDEYMFENLYRLLLQTKRMEELRDLLLSAGWAKRVLERKAVLQFVDAVASMQKQRSESTSGESAVRDVFDEDSMCGIELVMKALRLSLAYCDGSEEAAWFQLHARMMHKRRRLKSVEKFLSEIEKLAPRPWLRPVNDCLHGAGENLLEAVLFPEDWWGGEVEFRQGAETERVGGSSVVGCIRFRDRNEVTVFKYSEGKTLEIVGSCGENGKDAGAERERDWNEASPSNEPNQGTDVMNSERVANTEGEPELAQKRGCLALFTRCFGREPASSLGSIQERSPSEVSSIGRGPYPSASSTGGKNDTITTAHVCGRGQLLVVGYENGAVTVWNVKERKVIRTFQIDRSFASSMFLSSNGKLLACGCGDGSVLLWNVESETGGCVTMRGNTSWVNCVSISADGSFVVSGSSDGRVRVWGARSGSPVGQPITGHTGGVWSVALSGDGRRLLSGSLDYTVRLWDTRTGSQIGPTMRGHTSIVWSAAMSEDGRRAISASDNEMILWDLQTQIQLGNPIFYTSGTIKVTMNADGKRALSGGNGVLKLWNLEAVAQAEGKKARHTDTVSSLAMSKNGLRIISGSWDTSVQMWNAETGEHVSKPVTCVAMSGVGKKGISGYENGRVRSWDVGCGEQIGFAMDGSREKVNTVAMSKDGKLAMSGSDNGKLRVWNMERSRQIGKDLVSHPGAVVSMAMSWDGRRAISGCSEGKVGIWDTTSGLHMGDTMSDPAGGSLTVAMSGNGKRAVSGCRDGALTIWNAETGSRLGETLTEHTAGVSSTAIDGFGKVAVCGLDDGSIMFCNAEAATQLGQIFSAHKGSVCSVAISGDGKHVISGSVDGCMKLWNTTSRKQVGQAIKGKSARVGSVAMSEDGKIAMGGWEDGTIRTIDAETGREVGEAMVEHTGAVMDVALSKDGAYAISGSTDGTTRMWDLKTRSEIIAGHTNSVWSVAINGDGSRAVSGSLDETVRAWDVESGRQVGKAMTGHRERVNDVAISANGRYAVSGSDDTTVRAWHLGSETQMCNEMTGHTAEVKSVAMSADGKRAVSGSHDETARVWDLESGAQIGDALSGHAGPVWRVAMNEDGTRVLSSDDETIRVWDVEKGRRTKEVSVDDIGWQAACDRFLGDGKGFVKERGAVHESQQNRWAVSDILGNKVGYRLGDKLGDRILHRREDGTVATLARLDASIGVLQVDHGRGIVAAGLLNGVVAVLKVVC